MADIWTGERPLDRAFAGTREYLSVVRRHAFALAVYLLACLGAAGAYLHAVRPDFVATVQFVLQPRRVAAVGPAEERGVTQTILNGEQAETELQVVRSRGLLRDVFDARHLADVPELRDGRDGFWAEVYTVLHRFAFDAISPDPQAEAFDRFVNRVRTRRLGTSFVIEIGYRSRDPRLAAQVANAVAAAYLRNRIDSSYADAEVGAPFLKGRVASILAQDYRAADAVKHGALPADYLPDSDVRPLGPAVEPLGKLFPLTSPVLAFSTAFAIISGLLALALIGTLDLPLRSRRQLYRRMGIDCLGAIDARGSAWGGVAVPRRQVYGNSAEPWKAVRAAFSRRHSAGHPRTIGFASWEIGAGSRSAAARFTETFGSEADLPTFIDLDPSPEGRTADAPRSTRDLSQWLESKPRNPTLVIVLPPLGHPSVPSTLVPLLDAVVLVVEAHRTTCADVKAAIRFVDDRRGFLAGIVFHDAGRRGSGATRDAALHVRFADALRRRAGLTDVARRH